LAIELGGARLTWLERADCAALAAEIAAMPPWSVMNYPAERLERFLAARGDGAARYLVEIAGRPAGALSIRSPWLRGPYLELLALLPAAQGRGIGARILAWFEAEARREGARNLWVCASSFNTRAIKFYEKHGFRPAATLPDLVAEGHSEILLRKFPIG
jgi:GNAT superfamily N-acetyltransferase